MGWILNAKNLTVIKGWMVVINVLFLRIELKDVQRMNYTQSLSHGLPLVHNKN